LRGALPLMLGLQLYETHTAMFYSSHHMHREMTRMADETMILVSATVVLSLLMQGLTFELVTELVRINEPSCECACTKCVHVHTDYKQSVVGDLYQAIPERMTVAIDKMRRNSEDFAGVCWSRVNDVSCAVQTRIQYRCYKLCSIHIHAATLKVKCTISSASVIFDQCLLARPAWRRRCRQMTTVNHLQLATTGCIRRVNASMRRQIRVRR
jgi:hypothetical protein